MGERGKRNGVVRSKKGSRKTRDNGRSKEQLGGSSMQSRVVVEILSNIVYF